MNLKEQLHGFGFCDSGTPAGVAMLIRDVLADIKTRFDATQDIGLSHAMQYRIGSYEMQCWVLYWLTEKGLLTHKTSVSASSLTDAGELLLEMLQTGDLEQLLV